MKHYDRRITQTLMHAGNTISGGYASPANGPLGVNDQRYFSIKSLFQQYPALRAARYQQLTSQFQPSVRRYNLFWYLTPHPRLREQSGCAASGLQSRWNRSVMGLEFVRGDGQYVQLRCLIASSCSRCWSHVAGQATCILTAARLPCRMPWSQRLLAAILSNDVGRHQVEGSSVNSSTNASAVVCPSGYVRVRPTSFQSQLDSRC